MELTEVTGQDRAAASECWVCKLTVLDKRVSSAGPADFECYIREQGVLD